MELKFKDYEFNIEEFRDINIDKPMTKINIVENNRVIDPPIIIIGDDPSYKLIESACQIMVDNYEFSNEYIKAYKEEVETFVNKYAKMKFPSGKPVLDIVKPETRIIITITDDGTKIETSFKHLKENIILYKLITDEIRTKDSHTLEILCHEGFKRKGK